MGIKRYIEDGQVYFLTSVTKDRNPIFQDGKYANLLLAIIEYLKYYLDYRIYGYVIMPDHFHILIYAFGKYSISKIMNLIKGNFARKYNQIINNVGRTVWQRSYYDEVIRNSLDFFNKLNYMHNNPVKAGLVDDPKDYPFSSWHQYYGETRKLIQLGISKTNLVI
ncbi:MAG: transposase [Spirochaetes bacterium]|nr:transposase [Spirochaetota bacterium]